MTAGPPSFALEPADATLRCLLLQVRDAGDPMRTHELESFARALRPFDARVEVFDLLAEVLRPGRLREVDLVLMGGSGAYSAATPAPWLDRALESLRAVHDSGVPAFASCWGFQGMAAAMGGTVVQDRRRAEIGTHELVLTREGLADPVFGYLGPRFKAQMGHEDRVAELPRGTTLLASSEKVENQAYRFDDKPVYCTQFHPELDRSGMLRRFRTYPKYSEEVAGLTLAEVAGRIEETPKAAELVRRFAALHARPGAAGRPDSPSTPP